MKLQFIRISNEKFEMESDEGHLGNVGLLENIYESTTWAARRQQKLGSLLTERIAMRSAAGAKIHEAASIPRETKWPQLRAKETILHVRTRATITKGPT